MSIAVITQPFVKSEIQQLLIDKGLTQYQVTFATLNKVKFNLDFNTSVGPESVSLENVAEFTISTLKTSLHTPKGIIEKVTYDINEADWIIYFDIILGPSTTQTSLVELLNYLNNCL